MMFFAPGRPNDPNVVAPLIAAGAARFETPAVHYGTSRMLTAMQASADLTRELRLPPSYVPYGTATDTATQAVFNSLPPVAYVNGIRTIWNAEDGWDIAAGVLEAGLAIAPLVATKFGMPRPRVVRAGDIDPGLLAERRMALNADNDFGPLNQPVRTITGETASTRIGREAHAEFAAQRRQSGMFNVVNEPITDASGVPILVPKRVELKTGEPALGAPLQTANPDAVSYERSLLIDDKPVGRPLAKDRQEIIRNIEAYRRRQGSYPEKVVIQRYNPSTGQPVVSEIFAPSDFLPGGL